MSDLVDFPNIAMPIDALRLREYLPQRYPFIMIDRVTKIESELIQGFKNVSANESFFAGHFPSMPVMPGVLQIEAMAQLAGVLALLKSGRKPAEGQMFLFAGAEKIRFRKPVLPGDQLKMSAELILSRRGILKFRCHAKVDDLIVTSGEITLSAQEITLK